MKKLIALVLLTCFILVAGHGPDRSTTAHASPVQQTAGGENSEACRLITEVDIKAVFGEQASLKSKAGSDFNSGLSRGSVCSLAIYPHGDTGSFDYMIGSIQIVWAATPQAARQVLDLFYGAHGQPVESIGDAAFWESQSGRLSVLRGNAILSVDPGSKGSLQQAKSLTLLALNRLPTNGGADLVLPLLLLLIVGLAFQVMIFLWLTRRRRRVKASLVGLAIAIIVIGYIIFSRQLSVEPLALGVAIFLAPVAFCVGIALGMILMRRARFWRSRHTGIVLWQWPAAYLRVWIPYFVIRFLVSIAVISDRFGFGLRSTLAVSDWELSILYMGVLIGLWVVLFRRSRAISQGAVKDDRAQNYEEALFDQTRSLQLHPDDPATLNNRGVTYEQMGRHEEALADFDHSLQLRPDNPATLNNRGGIYEHMGSYEEALSDYTRSLQLRPDNPATLNKRGLAYAELGRYEEAIADYTRSLQLRPDHANTLTSRGATYAELGRHEEALADYNRSLQLRPNAPSTLNKRGITSYRLGSYEEALADLDLSLRLRPDDPAMLAYRGITYDRLGRYEEAIADLDLSLQLRPYDANTLANRGTAYAQLGLHEEALADLDHSLQLRPDDPDTLYKRGITSYRLGSYEAALSDYTRSLELRPDDPATLNQRGIAYEHMGRYEEALADYTRSLQLRPEHQRTAAARDRLLGRRQEKAHENT